MERLSQAEVQLNAISAQSGDLGEFVKVVQTITKIAKQLKDLLGSNGTLIDPNTLAVIHSKVDLLEACVDATSVGANDMVYKTKPARVALAMAITRASLTLGDPWVTVDEVKAATTRLQNAVATAVASRDITDNDIAAVPFRHHLCNSIHDANQACSTYLKDTKNPKIKAIRKQLRRAIHKANRVKGDHFSTVADVNKAIADLNKAVDDAIAAAQAV